MTGTPQLLPRPQLPFAPSGWLPAADSPKVRARIKISPLRFTPDEKVLVCMFDGHTVDLPVAEVRGGINECAKLHHQGRPISVVVTGISKKDFNGIPHCHLTVSQRQNERLGRKQKRAQQLFEALQPGSQHFVVVNGPAFPRKKGEGETAPPCGVFVQFEGALSEARALLHRNNILGGDDHFEQLTAGTRLKVAVRRRIEPKGGGWPKFEVREVGSV